MKNKGFTLVEVIVVAVIVALLAATATLLYGGYIKETRKNTVIELAEVAASAGNAYWRRTGKDLPTGDLVSVLNLFISDQKRFTVTLSTSSADFIVVDFYDDDGIIVPEYSHSIRYK